MKSQFQCRQLLYVGQWIVFVSYPREGGPVAVKGGRIDVSFDKSTKKVTCKVEDAEAVLEGTELTSYMNHRLSALNERCWDKLTTI